MKSISVIKQNLNGTWEFLKLEDVAKSISTGGTPKRSVNEYWENGNIPWLKISDLKSTYISNAGENITKEGLNNSSAKLFPKGTILYSIFATLGAIGILGFEATTNQAIAGILPNNDIIDTKYLYYCLISEKKNIMAKKSRATQDNINLKILRNHEIPVPPIKTQKKIRRILEKAEKLKEWRAEADQLADMFLKSVFLEMFGDPVKNEKEWKIKTIEELSSKIVDCPHSTPKYAEEITEFPCIRTTELKNGYINWKEMKYLNTEEYNERVKRLCPEEGDIVYGREGTFGEAVRVPKNTKVCLGQRVMLFRPKKSICNSIFLWALLRSDAIYHQALQKTSGSTVGHVNIKDIKKFRGFCPPIELQNQFADIVKQLETLKTYQKQSKQEIDSLFNVLMQKAFIGELTC